MSTGIGVMMAVAEVRADRHDEKRREFCRQRLFLLRAVGLGSILVLSVYFICRCCHQQGQDLMMPESEVPIVDDTVESSKHKLYPITAGHDPTSLTTPPTLELRKRKRRTLKNKGLGGVGRKQRTRGRANQKGEEAFDRAFFVRSGDRSSMVMGSSNGIVQPISSDTYVVEDEQNDGIIYSPGPDYRQGVDDSANGGQSKPNNSNNGARGDATGRVKGSRSKTETGNSGGAGGQAKGSVAEPEAGGDGRNKGALLEPQGEGLDAESANNGGVTGYAEGVLSEPQSKGSNEQVDKGKGVDEPVNGNLSEAEVDGVDGENDNTEGLDVLPEPQHEGVEGESDSSAGVDENAPLSEGSDGENGIGEGEYGHVQVVLSEPQSGVGDGKVTATVTGHEPQSEGSDGENGLSEGEYGHVQVVLPEPESDAGDGKVTATVPSYEPQREGADGNIDNNEEIDGQVEGFQSEQQMEFTDGQVIATVSRPLRDDGQGVGSKINGIPTEPALGNSEQVDGQSNGILSEPDIEGSGGQVTAVVARPAFDNGQGVDSRINGIPSQSALGHSEQVNGQVLNSENIEGVDGRINGIISQPNAGQEGQVSFQDSGGPVKGVISQPGFSNSAEVGQVNPILSTAEIGQSEGVDGRVQGIRSEPLLDESP
ncbi:expressed unknown protein [Seminavis robusta]|uniref:Uncharacterized protein n=1 Tax=Seminavis robusta TaxID=568900 RepID=A0A9N8HGZ3_9STRA|nr:expressed unknown protein [Seminavis robusta]|eukprot:Sro535_g161960.1 n/a (652) ;mRNA; f:22237-24192